MKVINTMKNRFILSAIGLLLCMVAQAQPVTITPPEAFIELGESVTLTASGAIYYTWSPATGLSTTEGPVTVASPTVTTTYTCSGFALGDESVINSNFDQGNIGFTSAYTYTNDLQPEGTYSVGPDASAFHPDFVGTGHGGSGNFMVVNGATSPGTNVWTEQITVNPNTYYAFSTWVCTVSPAGDVARLQFSINGTQIGDVFMAPDYTNEWLQFYELWYSGDNTSASITILNQNTAGGGNDFGLDDISFCELVLVGAPECTVHVGSMSASATADQTEFCEGGSTTLHATATGGTNDYTFSWSPANTLDNPNAQHPVATPPVGTTTYTCHVSDGLTEQDVAVTVTVYPNVTKYIETSICENDSYDFFGQMLTEPGPYEHHLQTIHGCDSLIHLTLSVDEYQMPPVVEQYECYAHGTTPSWTWDKTGTTYHEDATDEILLDDPNGGCPILHRLDLRFHEEYLNESSKTACNEFYWPVSGETYTQSQEITKTFHHEFGDKICDSTYILHLTIANYETTDLFDETGCDSYVWNPKGHDYTTNDDCDPVDHIYTESGIYRRTYQNQMGCDSIVTVYLNLDYSPHPTEIMPVDPEIPAPHWVITATEFQVNSYDYYVQDINPECEWDSVGWSFATPSEWILEPSGDKHERCRVYVLDHVDDTVWLEARAYNHCATDGVTQRYWLIASFYDVDEYGVSTGSGSFTVMPNPNNGQMDIRFEQLTGKIDLKVYDMRGVLIDNLQVFNDLDIFVLNYNMKNHADGIYLFVATGKEGTVTRKVVVNP